ncbi:MAG: hypothetical protein ABJO36_14210 [Litorimonas sp.]
MKLYASASLAILLVTASSLTAEAKMSVNQAQECQAVLDFTIERVESVGKYNKADVKTVTKGLRAYEAFLQSEHVTPALMVFTKGDQKAAADYQIQIDAYKAQIVNGLKAKHPQERIFTDQAVAINNCYTAAPMSDDKLQMMTDAVQGIVVLAKQG